MRVLLDECMPAGLRRDLPGHEVTTVQRMDWSGTKNGTLLDLIASAGFDAFVTVDKGIQFQQRVAALPFGIIALRTRSNDVVHLRPLMSGVLTALAHLTAGQLVRLP